MLYETLSQPTIFCLMAVFGFLSGFVFDAFNFIKFLCDKKVVISHILDFFATIGVCCVFYFANLDFAYGEIRFYTILVFTLTFLLERNTLSKLLEKIYVACYNAFVKISKRLVSFFAKKPKKQQEKG